MRKQQPPLASGGFAADHKGIRLPTHYAKVTFIRGSYCGIAGMSAPCATDIYITLALDHLFFVSRWLGGKLIQRLSFAGLKRNKNECRELFLRIKCQFN